jgi:hypothetical protein
MANVAGFHHALGGAAIAIEAITIITIFLIALAVAAYRVAIVPHIWRAAPAEIAVLNPAGLGAPIATFCIAVVTSFVPCAAQVATMCFAYRW